VILANDRLNKHGNIDAVFRQIETSVLKHKDEETGKPYIELLSLATMIAEDLKKGGKAEIDFSAADKVAATIANQTDRCEFHYFLGKYLSLHGKPDQAVRYWKKCMGCPTMYAMCRTLAGAELVERGVKPEEYKELLKEPATEDQKPK
jgi:hypothetical protein